MKRFVGLAILLSLALSLLAAPAAFAADFRTDTDVTIGAGEVIDDDLYLFATSVTIDGTVNGDVFILATSLKINGTVNGGAAIAANDVVIAGEVTQRVRVASNSVLVTGSIGGDLLAAANDVKIDPGAVIGRDLILAVNSLTLDGAVERRVGGAVSSATLNGAVGTDVDIDVENLTVTGDASIGRDLTYRSDNAAEIAQGAQIGGEVTAEAAADMDAAADSGFSFDSIVPALVGLVIAAVYGTVMLFGLPRITLATSNQLIESPLLSLGLGVVSLILVPIIAILVMVTVVGIPVGLALILLYVVALYSGQVFVGMSIGRLILSFFSDANRRLMQFLGLLLGLVILSAITFIPYVGAWTGLIVAIFGLGGLMITIGRLRREPARAASPPAEG